MATKLYAGKLLFALERSAPGEKARSYQLIEERIVHLYARNMQSALNKMRNYGKRHTMDMSPGPGRVWMQRFLGIADVNDIKLEDDGGVTEIWYEFKVRHLPVKNRKKYVFTDKELMTKTAAELRKSRRIALFN